MCEEKADKASYLCFISLFGFNAVALKREVICACIKLDFGIPNIFPSYITYNRICKF